MKELRRFVLNGIVITINIITIKITDLVLLPIVNIVQMVQLVVTIACCPVAVFEYSTCIILTYSGHIIKTNIFRLILVAVCRVTGTNNQCIYCIVCPTVIFSRRFSSIIFSVNRLKPDVISPIIHRSSGESHNYVIAVSIISSTKNVFIQNGNNAFNRT